MARGFVDIFRSLFTGADQLNENMLPVELDISRGSQATTIYAQKTRAAILGSVFSIQASTPDDRPASLAENTPAPQSVSSKIRVGEDLRAAKDKIVSCGEQLHRLSDASLRGHIAGLTGVFRTQICRIAVLGQMNAGKSTLINTLIERTDLLPAEITPWTTVVTNLHFGVPDMPEKGAVFEFFDTDEWQRLAEGSARLRELTERLMPDFDWQTFYHQVGDMREKAREKLGPQFEDLLGGQHSFPEITPSLLRKYICAEPVIEEPGETGTGEFSPITKAANLYFELGGFFYPTLVIDTPGINDPFLVRDEITRQNLERANVFIIVVTARQPLSNADVDLLRILRGLDKDRIIVFVNKIDEVENFPEFEKAIVQRVKGVLEKEFPASRIPVVTGSARWAADILSAEGEARLPELLASVDRSKPDSEELKEAGRSYFAFDSSVEETLAAEEILMASGVPALALAISEMMQSGPIADYLRFSSVALAAIAVNGAACAEANAAMAGRFLESARSRTILEEAELSQVRQVLQRMSETAAEIGDIVASSQSRVEERISAGFSKLREMLGARLEEHVAIMSIPGTDPGSAAYGGGSSVNVMPLRAALEQEFAGEFARIYSDVVNLTREGEARIQDLVGRIRTDCGVGIVYTPLPLLKLAPPLGPLGDPIALASGGTIQAQWLRQQISPEERVSKFRELIRSEFAIIIGKLCAEGAQEMERAADFILNHFRMSVLHFAEASARARQADLDSYLAALAAPETEQRVYAESLEQELAKLNASVAESRGIAAELMTLRE